MEGICSVCKEHKTLHHNRKTGKLICHNCYRKDPSTHEECSKCGKVKPVGMRTESGKLICHNCYQRQQRVDIVATRPV